MNELHILLINGRSGYSTFAHYGILYTLSSFTKSDTSIPRVLHISAGVGALFLICLWIGPAALRPDIFDGDAAHHVFWLYQYADPELFPNDLSVHYLRTSAPLGYRALYWLVAPLVDVLTAAEWLSAVLLLTSAWLAWHIALFIGGNDSGAEARALYALVGVAVVVVFGQETGGVLPPIAFQRSFALPLVLICLYGFVSRRYFLVGASWIASALFYPVMSAVLGISGCLFFLYRWTADRKLPDCWAANVVMGIAALAAVYWGMPKAEDLGATTTYLQAMTMPEFGAHGRLKLYAEGWTRNLLQFHMTGLGWQSYFFAILLLLVGILYGAGRRALIPASVWLILSVGCSLWLVIRLFPEQLMFGLYLPNRHSRWAIAVFAIVVISGGMYVAGDFLLRRLRGGILPNWTNASLRIAVIAAPLFVGIALGPSAARQLREPVDIDLEKTYAFIASLPKDTLVAAHPDLANYIPLRTKRSVLVSTEISMPWRLGYYAEMKRRLEASFRAAYATNITDFDVQLAPYDVDVFVTGPMVWKATGYHEPYNTEFVQDLLVRGRKESFVLESPPAERVLFRSGGYYVVRVGKSAQPLEKSQR